MVEMVGVEGEGEGWWVVCLLKIHEMIRDIIKVHREKLPVLDVQHLWTI